MNHYNPNLKAFAEIKAEFRLTPLNYSSTISPSRKIKRLYVGGLMKFHHFIRLIKCHSEFLRVDWVNFSDQIGRIAT